MVAKLIAIAFVLIAISGVVHASPPAMQVDGQPYFPIGWYTSGMPGSVDATRDYLSIMQAQGMNSALICYGVEDSDTAMTNYLDAAGQLGMKIMVEVQRYAVQGLEGYPPSLIDHQVDLCKGYPGMLGWYLMDEPEYWGVTPAMLQARYAQIKGRDPQHNILVCHGTYPTHNAAIGFLNAEPPPYTDGFMPYTYVVGPPYIAEFAGANWEVTQAAKADVALAQSHNKNVVIDVLQAHQWSNLRLPTYAEQRYQSYGPITVGARGLYYWMYYDEYSPESYRTTVIGPIAREVSRLIPAIMSNSTAAATTSSRDADTTGQGIPDVTYMFGEDAHAGYLLAVNNTASTIPVTFQLSGRVPAGASTSIPVAFESRSVTAQPSFDHSLCTLTDTFTPYDVNVYRLYAKEPSISVDLGLPDVIDGVTPIQNSDGDTSVVTSMAGVNCRQNATPSDSYFYFGVDDSFAFQGSNTCLDIAIRYYDSGSGSLQLQYDAADSPYKSGGSVALTGSNTWRDYTFHVSDAYFGNRQNGGADFRISGTPGNTFYLDTVRVAPRTYVTSDKPDGVYKSAEQMNIQVVFPVPVYVTGAPQLELETGSTDRRASYVSGSGTNTLALSYTVQLGDTSSDLDCTGKNALMLNGGSIKDVGGSDMDLTLPSPGAGGSLGSAKTIVIDTTPTTVWDVTSDKSDGIYKAGVEIRVQVRFETPVFVTGSPQLELETGGIDRRASYLSDSGTNTLTYSYIIQPGDGSSHLDYTGAGAMILNGGSIKDIIGTDVDLTLPAPGLVHSLGAAKSLAIDTVIPAALSVTSSKADGPCKIGDAVSVQVAFSEPVNVTGVPRLELETGTTDRKASYVSGSGTSTLSFSYTVQTGDVSPHLDCTGTGALTLNGGTIKDPALNDAILIVPSPGSAGSLGASKSIVIDGVRPSVVSVTSDKPDGSYKAGENIDISVTFTEPMVATGTPLLELETGAVDQKASYISGSGTSALVFRYSVQQGDTSSDLSYKATSSLTGTIKDVAGNSGSVTLPALGSANSLSGSKALVIDTTAPSTTASPVSGVYGSPREITLMASEAGQVYYTIDSSEPTTASLCYAAPIPVSADTVLRFYAVDTAGNEESPKKQETYKILSEVGSIALAKGLDDGAPVRLGNKVLYLKRAGFGYIEESSRASGIRIEGGISANEGDLVCLAGTLHKLSGAEPCIVLEMLTSAGSGPVRPLGMPNRTVEAGISCGLYVRAWGVVLPGSVTANSYVITDGSDATGIRVITPSAPSVSVGQFVTVTGAAGYDGGRIIYSR